MRAVRIALTIHSLPFTVFVQFSSALKVIEIFMDRGQSNAVVTSGQWQSMPGHKNSLLKKGGGEG